MHDTTGTPSEALRTWSRGILPLMAATELLIRGGYAQSWRPWVRNLGARVWIDFEAIPSLIGGMSGGEGRIMRIAASLGADIPVALGDAIPGLDADHLTLVLEAIRHANGTSLLTDGDDSWT